VIAETMRMAKISQDEGGDKWDRTTFKRCEEEPKREKGPPSHYNTDTKE